MKTAIKEIESILKSNKSYNRFNGSFGYTIKQVGTNTFRIRDNDLADSIALELKDAGLKVRLEVGSTAVLVKVGA